jgi:hypothetical protein
MTLKTSEARGVTSTTVETSLCGGAPLPDRKRRGDGSLIAGLKQTKLAVVVPALLQVGGLLV